VQAKNPDVLVKVDETFSSTHNPYWVIKKAVQFRFGETPDGTILNIPVGVQFNTEPLHAETMTAEDWGKVRDQLLKGTACR
jgi:hypothetical protein